MEPKGMPTIEIPSQQPETPMAISNSHSTLCCYDGSVSYSNPVSPRHAPLWGFNLYEVTCPFHHPNLQVASKQVGCMGTEVTSPFFVAVCIKLLSLPRHVSGLFFLFILFYCFINGARCSSRMAIIQAALSSKVVFRWHL